MAAATRWRWSGGY